MNEDNLLRLIAGMIGVLTALALAVALAVGKDVFVPFALALFGAFAAEPLVQQMRRVHIPRWVAAMAVVGCLYLAVQVTFSMVASTADEFEIRLPSYLAAVQQLIDSLPLHEATAKMIRVDDPSFWQEMLPIKALVGNVGSAARALTTFAANIVLVLLIMVAIIIGRRRVDERLDRAAGAATGDADRSTRMLTAIDQGIQRYMLLKSLLSLGVGFSLWLVLSLFGVDFAVLWGFLGFILNFIPTVGPILATVPIVLLIFLQFADSLGYAVAASLCTAVVPFVFGNIIEPKVFGDSLNLNFFAVLFALVLWSFLWGVAGAVLSVPIMMAVSVVCREIGPLRPIHDLLRS
jgi:predicted PurR-regulated permease PerM